MMKQVIIYVFVLLCSFATQVQAQQETTTIRDSEWVILPAIAYTPETSLTMGAFTQYYFDFAKDNKSRMSMIQVGAIYTLRNQIYLGAEVNLFPENEDYIGIVKTKYSKFTDRDYGIGNDAQAVIYETVDDKLDSMNFMNYKYQSFGFNATGLKKVAKGFYIGGSYWLESLWDYGRVADKTEIKVTERDEFSKEYFDGTRSGIALSMMYDNRKNSNNPLKGTYVQFNNWYYRKWLGSKYEYTSISLDARHYINTFKDQTLALRLRSEQRYTMNGSIVPKFDLPRVGGKEFARGYYEGTYVDDHMYAFELEYRMPLFHDAPSKLWQFWKRLGVAAFMSGSKVYTGWDEFSFDDIRYTVGGGLRYVLSEEQRVNIRIDVGYGLDKNAGFDKNNLGVYFYFSEAF